MLDSELMSNNRVNTALKLRSYLATQGYKSDERPYICLLGSNEQMENFDVEQ